MGFAARDARTRCRVQALCVFTIGMERQVTFAPHGHILTNYGVWSPDGRRIVYDVRSDPGGDVFDGDRIESVDVETGEVRVLYQSVFGAKCGVATFHPTADSVVFILGPENPPRIQLSRTCRRGVIVVAFSRTGPSADARNVVPPFTPGHCGVDRMSTSIRPTADSSASRTRITSWRRVLANRTSATSA